MRSWPLLIALALVCVAGYVTLNSCGKEPEPDFSSGFTPASTRGGNDAFVDVDMHDVIPPGSGGVIPRGRRTRASTPTRVPSESVSKVATPPAITSDQESVVPEPAEPVNTDAGETDVVNLAPSNDVSSEDAPVGASIKEDAPHTAGAMDDLAPVADTAPRDVDLPAGGGCTLRVHVPTVLGMQVKHVAIRPLGENPTSADVTARSLLSLLLEGGATAFRPTQSTTPVSEVATFAELPAGVYQVETAWSDGISIRHAVGLSADRITREVRTPRPKTLAPLRGRVVFPDGRPFVGVVTVMPRSTRSGPLALLDAAQTTKTKPDGTFLVPHVAGHDVVVSVRLREHVRVLGPRRALPIKGTYEFKIPSFAGGVQGRVLDALTKEPIPGAVLHAGIGDFDSGLTVIRAATDRNGRYAMPWRNARAGLFVSAPGYGPLVLDADALEAGGARVIELVEGARVFGKVHRAGNEKTVAGVRVHVVPQDGGDAVMGAERMRSGVSDNDGHYLITGVPIGGAFVFAHDKRYTSLMASKMSNDSLSATLTPVRTLTSRGQHEWRLDVRPTTVVRGVVRYAQGTPVPSCLVGASAEEVPTAIARVLRTSTVTDARGRFTLRGLVTGLSYQVRAEGPFHVVASESVVATSTGSEVRLDLALDHSPGQSLNPTDASEDTVPPSTQEPTPDATATRKPAIPPDDLTPLDVDMPSIAAARGEPRVLRRESNPPVAPANDLESLPLTAIPPRARTPSTRAVSKNEPTPAAAPGPEVPEVPEAPELKRTGALTVHVRGVEERSEWIHLQLLRSADGIRLRAALRPGGTSVTFKRMRIGEHYTLWAPLGKGRFLYHGDVWGTEGELTVTAATGATIRGPLHGQLPARHKLASVFATRTGGAPLRITGRVDTERREYVVEGLPPGTWRIEVEIWDLNKQRVRGAATLPAGGSAPIELTPR